MSRVVFHFRKNGRVPIHLKMSKGDYYGRNQSDSVVLIYRQVIFD